jgi:hypothetical protein
MLALSLQTYILILVGLVTRDQEEVITYLQAENKVLREQLDAALGGKRMRFSERQRRPLAEFRRKLGWRRLARYCQVVTPRTIYSWHARLIAAANMDIRELRRRKCDVTESQAFFASR